MCLADLWPCLRVVVKTYKSTEHCNRHKTSLIPSFSLPWRDGGSCQFSQHLGDHILIEGHPNSQPGNQKRSDLSSPLQSSGWSPSYISTFSHIPFSHFLPFCCLTADLAWPGKSSHFVTPIHIIKERFVIIYIIILGGFPLVSQHQYD